MEGFIKGQQAAEALNLTSEWLQENGIIDQIIHEYHSGENLGPLRDFLANQFNELANLPIDQLLRQREQRYRNF